jgi:hypothetical protein
MRRTELEFDKFAWTSVPKLAVIAVLLMGCLSIYSAAQQPGQKTFSSPEDASNALFTAIQSNDEKVMLEILGRDGKQIVSSGDEAEDAESRAKFVQKYQQLHRLVKSRTERPPCTSARRIGLRPYRW